MDDLAAGLVRLGLCAIAYVIARILIIYRSK